MIRVMIAIRIFEVHINTFILHLILFIGGSIHINGFLD